MYESNANTNLLYYQTTINNTFRFQNHRYKTKRATHDKRGGSLSGDLGQGLYHSQHGAGDHNAVAAAAAYKQAQQQQQSNHHLHNHGHHHHHHHPHSAAAAAAHHAHDIDILAATVAAAQRSQAAAAAAAVAALNSNQIIGDVVVNQNHHNSLGAPNSNQVSVVPTPMLLHDKHWPQAPY